MWLWHSTTVAMEWNSDGSQRRCKLVGIGTQNTVARRRLPVGVLKTRDVPYNAGDVATLPQDQDDTTAREKNSAAAAAGHAPPTPLDNSCCSCWACACKEYMHRIYTLHGDDVPSAPPRRVYTLYTVLMYIFTYIIYV